MKKYDAIFIGSGIGAMVCASLLAKLLKKRVLIVERHFKFGGYTHVFKRKEKFLWDVGVHYIGEMKKGSLLKEVFDFITDKKLTWSKMPSPYDVFIYPDHKIFAYEDPKEYKKELINLFPKEKRGILTYFQDIKSLLWRMQIRLGRGKPIEFSPQEKEALSTEEYLKRVIKDPKLQAILTSQWGDYGLPPKYSSFFMHALVVGHYLNGAYYPVGSSQKIGKYVQESLKKEEVEILLEHEVKEILVEKNQAIGVRAKNKKTQEEKEFFGKYIISNAGVYNTYFKLLPLSIDLPERKLLQELLKEYPIPGCITLYIGFKESPEKLGVKGENYWIYPSYDHNQTFQSNWIEEEKEPFMYLSFPSLKDPSSKAHTAEIISFAPYKIFQPYEEQEWKKREEAYYRLKEKITKKLLESIEKHFPGLSSLVEYLELATPVTYRYFTDHYQGSIYAFPCGKKRWILPYASLFQGKTPIENLYITGADAFSPGIAGAMIGGLKTFSLLPEGLSFPITILKVKKKLLLKI